MAGTLTLSLLSAQSGLLTSQSALDTIANNISNVNTPGYSRKITQYETRLVNGAGAGVQVADIVRNVDEGLLKSLRTELSALNRFSSQETSFLRLQDSFGTPEDNTSLSHLVTDMQASMEALAQTPEGTLEQSELVRWALEVTEEMQSMSTTIQDLRLEADAGIETVVDEINELITDIGVLNDSIVKAGVNQGDTTGLRDQRDQSLTSLSELMDIQYYTRSDGQVIVFTGGGKTLVDSDANTVVFNPASFASAATSKAGGEMSGIYINSVTDGNDISDTISGGKLKGFLELRDETLPNLQAQLDEYASELRDAVNQIHNAGIPFPGLQSMAGTRDFIDTTDSANTVNQTITLDPTNSADDVAIVLMDADGNQTSVTTLDTIMTSGTYGTGAQTSRGPWSVTEVAATVEDWLIDQGLSNATASIDSAGHFVIELNSTTSYLSFRDQESSTYGSTQGDAEIGFDSDGDGTVDETISGFSNFFGLNDFFVDTNNASTYETSVLSSTYSAAAATLRFADGTSTLPLDPGGGGDVTITITAGDTLSDIANNINNNVSNVVADVVPDGAGFRLRIAHSTGETLSITDSSGGTLLSDIGLEVSATGTTESLTVRSDIEASPSSVSRGQIQWDASLGSGGEYYTRAGDGSSIALLADKMLTANSFDTAGGLTSVSKSFVNQAISILSSNASDSAAVENQIAYKTTLTQSLDLQATSISGVNIDEEMATLIVVEQAYAAAAQVITVIQDMFDALEQIVR